MKSNAIESELLCLSATSTKLVCALVYCVSYISVLFHLFFSLFITVGIPYFLLSCIFVSVHTLSRCIFVCFFVLSLHFGSVVFAGNHHAIYVDTWIRVDMLIYVYIMIYVPWSPSVPKPHLLLLVRGGLGLCSANPRPGYWNNLFCDWLGAAWARLVVRPVRLGGTAPSRISGDDLPLTARSAILSAPLRDWSTHCGARAPGCLARYRRIVWIAHLWLTPSIRVPGYNPYSGVCPHEFIAYIYTCI